VKTIFLAEEAKKPYQLVMNGIGEDSKATYFYKPLDKLTYENDVVGF
jgi:hypothetical protein